MELEIRDLSKRYGKKTAVSGVELTITPGVWGLIGANGAGKTTLMRMLAGILAPSAGRVLYDGVDIRDLGRPTGTRWAICPRASVSTPSSRSRTTSNTSPRSRA